MPDLRDAIFFISSVSDVSEILPLTAWLFVAQKKMPYTLLGILFLISSILKIYSLITAELHINNMPAFHLLALVEIALVYCFYNQLIFRKIHWLALIAISLANVLNTLFLQDIHSFNSLAWAFNMILLIVLGLMYFYKIYNDDYDYTPLNERPAFIITSGWLIYASGALFTYLLGTEILSGTPDGFYKNAWVFQCISNILKNVIIGYGFWLIGKKCLT
ncbi:hypothetical protein HQN86_19230 [Pedobacter panaciterrae]|uniref:hypothetical protein n=1 Tax=Pedobacter panaciterrae TaxID=363849 RepID=UPI00155D92CC|nr:hypothetical protein [Pedobacter panaciterrae]NQX55763.1 hypothetical protein [Pedobacter panaciterrae]